MSKTGINAGGYQITNVQSGGDTLTNAANIGDISRIAAKYDKYLQRGSATYEANGNGKINMTGTNGLTAEVTGLKNTYVTSGTVSNDGKRLTLTVMTIKHSMLISLKSLMVFPKLTTV